MSEERGRITEPATANERIFNEEVRRACLFERAKRRISRDIETEITSDLDTLREIIDRHFMRITVADRSDIGSAIERAQEQILAEIEDILLRSEETIRNAILEMIELEAETNRLFMIGLFSETGLSVPLSATQTTSLRTIARGREVEASGEAPADDGTRPAGRIGPRSATPVRGLPIRLNFPTQTELLQISRDVNFMGIPLEQERMRLAGRITNQSIGAIRTTARDNQNLSGLRTRRRNLFRRIIAGRSALFRTAAQDAVIQTKTAFQNRNPDNFSRYIWVSVLDSRTSNVCIARSGRVFPREEGPVPPAHPGCRSTISAIISREVRGASENGIFTATAPAPITFTNFLDSISLEEQNNILGSFRARLFRRGQLDVSQLVNRIGDDLSIEQLQQRLG